MASRGRTALAVLGLAVLVAGCATSTGSRSTLDRAAPGAGSPAPLADSEVLPWRAIDDPRQLPRPWSGVEAGLRSSVCPGVCAYDRHSPGDERVLGWWRDEAVLFDQVGAGAVTRLWMTTGDGRSQPLPDDVVLRVYVDGARRPVVDLPLPRLFDGSSPPFTPPLAFDRLRSSGGNVSHVPIPFRRACRITLSGPGLDELKLWYQIDHLLLDRPSATIDDLVPFGARGFSRELEPLRRLLSTVDPLPAYGGLDAGPEVLTRDAWAPAAARGMPVGRWIEDQGQLEAGVPLALFVAERPGSLTGLRLELPSRLWRHVRLRLEVDGRVTVDERLAAVFAGWRTTFAQPLATVFVRHDPGADALALDFPMPWHDDARLELHLDAAAEEPVSVRWCVRHLDEPPPPDAMHFAVATRGARLRDGDPPRSLPLLDVVGAGKWVGLAADLVAERGPRTYLEGDEYVWIDDEPAPRLVGTGVEDFFSGGFYFDTGPFSTPLHAVPHHGGTRRDRATGALRLRLLDAVPFESALRAELEAGPEGATPMRSLAVSYLYVSPQDVSPQDVSPQDVAPSSSPSQ
ncbi:MAG: DUF2961 domain-containing protein [Acidobacteriota bacterium]